MSEAMDEQNAQPAREAEATLASQRKRVLTVRARGVEPVGPDEISREQFEEIGSDKTTGYRVRSVMPPVTNSHGYKR